MSKGRLHIADAVGQIEAGSDEAGRGCLAGPVFAAAVILPNQPSVSLTKMLDDSKRLSSKTRNALRIIIEQEAVAFGVAWVDVADIDSVNILNASFIAMHKAIDKLSLMPECLIIDGNRFKLYREIPHKCIVKADAKFMHVAAASVLAKTWRDEYMLQLHEQYPNYGWDTNMGYPTAKHLRALQSFGITPHHRKTFGPVAQLRLPFP